MENSKAWDRHSDYFSFYEVSERLSLLSVLLEDTTHRTGTNHIKQELHTDLCFFVSEELKRISYYVSSFDRS
jgi:hypothetical protein